MSSKSNVREFIKSLPDNAKACEGPLMYDPSKFITPDMRLFKKSKNGYQEQVLSNGTIWSWTGAKYIKPEYLNADGSIQEEYLDKNRHAKKECLEFMPSYDGFYSKGKDKSNGKATGKSTAMAIVCYYFHEKIDPIGMRAVLKDPSLPIHANNIKWVTKAEQTSLRNIHRESTLTDESGKFIRKNGINIPESEVDLDDYRLWLNLVFVKNDGTQVLSAHRVNGDNGLEYEVKTMRKGADGYYSINIYIDGKNHIYRMNRVMAAIHHELDINDDKKHVDHINGDIHDNRPKNLEVVSSQENTRRGASANVLYKVDPNTMQILERIRCVAEYVEDNPNLNLSVKTLHRVSSIGIPYKGFIWIEAKLVNTLYTINTTSDTITLLHASMLDIHLQMQTEINELCEEGIISQDMISVNNSLFIPNETLKQILCQLDSRGIGDVKKQLELNNFIRDNHLPCSWVISHHGKSKNSQYVLCLSSMFIYLRSRENLRETDRTCPMCGPQGKSRRFVKQLDPINIMPVYSYYPAGGDRANKQPLKFIQRYENVMDAIKGIAGNDLNSTNLKSIRWSLFGRENPNSDYWLKKSLNGFSKRCVSGDLWWSYYPPQMDKLNESNPDWLLERRLNCASMNFVRNMSLTQK